MSELAVIFGDELSTETSSAKEWCLVRWMSGGRFCGPLSPLRADRYITELGFPNGQIGNVVLFDSEEQAALASADSLGFRDHPTHLSDLHFSVRAYCYYDGKEACLYDGGLLSEALNIRDMAVGRTVGANVKDRYKIEVECKFLGTPPPHNLPDTSEKGHRELGK